MTTNRKSVGRLALALGAAALAVAVWGQEKAMPNPTAPPGNFATPAAGPERGTTSGRPPAPRTTPLMATPGAQTTPPSGNAPRETPTPLAGMGRTPMATMPPM